MAQVVIPIVGITLAEAAKALGIAGISWGGTKIFESVSKAVKGATDPNEATKKQLENALTELNKIKASIHDVHDQIRNLRIETKIDQIQEHVDIINALYDQYTTPAAALAEAAKICDSDPHHQLQKCVHRCTEVGKQVIKEIHPALVHINIALVDQGDQGLLHLLQAEHVSENKDFLAQYWTLKAALLKYFLVEARAIVLLDLANEDDTGVWPERG